VSEEKSIVRIAWFGDIVGKAGRAAAVHAAKALRAGAHPPHLIVANAENARHGRGLHPEGYDELRGGGAGGIDLITLGDHAMDDDRILPMLKDPKAPVIAPINMDLPDGVKRLWTSPLPTSVIPQSAIRNPQSTETLITLVFMTVLGRIFMRTEFPDPFATLDAAMESISIAHPGALVFLEVHAEATSEKQALAWHARLKWGGSQSPIVETNPDRARIVSVVGSHTHVQTSDARIIDDRVAVLTDLGMTGASRSVIGFLIEGSIARLKTPPSGGLDVAEENPVAHGALIEIDVAQRKPVKVEAIRIPV